MVAEEKGDFDKNNESQYGLFTIGLKLINYTNIIGKKQTKIILDGDWLGVTFDGLSLKNELLQMRRMLIRRSRNC